MGLASKFLEDADERFNATKEVFLNVVEVLEGAGMVEFKENDDGVVQMRVTNLGDEAFGLLGLALPIHRVNALYVLATGMYAEIEALVAAMEKNDG